MIWLLILACGDNEGPFRPFVDADLDGYRVSDGDCDDFDATINPGAEEVCDQFDSDCDGLVDEGTMTVWYRDWDGDGFGHPDKSVLTCDDLSGFVINGGDCDDGHDAIAPGAPDQFCDGIDHDCDGAVDEGGDCY